jgi:hypothetical protein
MAIEDSGAAMIQAAQDYLTGDALGEKPAAEAIEVVELIGLLKRSAPVLRALAAYAQATNNYTRGRPK